MKIQDSRVIVTGGAGFIGSHLVDRLLSAKNEVIIIDDYSTGSLDNIVHHAHNDNLHIAEANILDESAMMELHNKVDFVFHLACRNIRLSLQHPTIVHEVNVTGTLNVLKAAAAARVKRFLYCSSSEVNGTANAVPMQEDYHFCPETIYGASKLAGEYYTSVFHRSGWLNTVIARPHNNYGPREHYEGNRGEVIPRFIIRALNNLPLIIYGDGSQTRDFTYVTETANLMVKLLEHNNTGGSTFNICRGQEISILELTKVIREIIGQDIIVQHFPSRPNDVMRLYGDPTRLQQTIGLAPQISFRDGLIDTIDWFRKNIPMTKKVLESIELKNWETTEAESWLKKIKK